MEPTWLGLAALPVVAGCFTIWLEAARRKTYSVVLEALPEGTLLLDVRQAGQVLLVVRPHGKLPATAALPVRGTREDL